MKYHEYLLIFLNLEEDLLSYTKEIEYNKQTKNFYTHKLSLLLLQTGCIAESLLSDLSINSPTVQGHIIWNWTDNTRIWQNEKVGNSFTLKLDNQQKRTIEGFKKMAYVCEKVFDLSSKKITFFHNSKLQYFLEEDDDYSTEYLPYQDLSGCFYFQGLVIQPRQPFPTGSRIPIWWASYNKVKHNIGNASINPTKVTYERVMQAMSGLFTLLAYCDIEKELLKANGMIIVENRSEVFKTKMFAAKI